MPEFDFSKQIKARYTQMCDSCNKELNTSVAWESRPDVLSLSIDEKDDEGCCRYRSYHFCSDSCAIKFLQNRKKT